MGSGFRTFASGEVLTASNVQNYLMDQAVMVFAGTAARASALPSPEVGMTAYSTATGLQVYNGTAWVDVSTGYGSGTGGSGTAVGTAIGGVNYNVHTFTGDATFTVTKAGLFDIECYGGGGGGGGGDSGATSRGGGGGGAGGRIRTTVYLDANQSVTVGAGGAGGAVQAAGSVGSRSQVGARLVMIGGGGGRADSLGIALANGGGGYGESGKTTGGTSILGTDYGNNGGCQRRRRWRWRFYTSRSKRRN